MQTTNQNLPGDSGDYHLLALGVRLSAEVEGLTCEIGLRRGGGSYVIMDSIKQYCPRKTHVAIDPYGHIPYEHKEGQVVQLDYTNEMRDDCLMNIYQFARHIKCSFIFFNLEDTEFFSRFKDGVPVYNVEKKLEDKYSFVHFDGPHAVKPLVDEIKFFLHRTPVGGCWVFDDVVGYYDHDLIEKIIFENGFELVEKLHHKALYIRRHE